MIEEGDIIGHLLCESHLVCDDDHGHTLVGEFRHHVQHFVDEFGIQRGGRLVKEHDLWIHGEGARNGNALLLPARKLGGICVYFVPESHPFELPACLLPRGLGIHPTNLREAEGHISQSSQVREQVERLEDHPNLLADPLRPDFGRCNPDAFEVNVPLVGKDEEVQTPQEGRLAGARGSDDTRDLPLCHFHADSAKYVQFAEPFVDSVGSNHSCAASRPGTFERFSAYRTIHTTAYVSTK